MWIVCCAGRIGNSFHLEFVVDYCFSGLYNSSQLVLWLLKMVRAVVVRVLVRFSNVEFRYFSLTRFEYQTRMVQQMDAAR